MSPRGRRRLRGVVAGAALVLALPPAAAASAAGGPPGRLPQTRVEPSFAGALTRSMARLAAAIGRDDPARALAVFFPEPAYVRMKTGRIPDPAADYADRLVAFFRLDVAAYHAVLDAGSPARFVRVVADPADAQWIPPGACENAIGYWHEPGVRLVFAHDHRFVSVGVDSLISWRGVWYVVHLGPNPRPRDVGTVLGYSLGPGRPGPPGGC